jgi:hypothetical protein
LHFFIRILVDIYGMTLQQLRQSIAGSEWTSVAVEIRPSTFRTDGPVKPFWCTREFYYPDADTFHLTFLNFADPYGKVPTLEMIIKGHILYGKELQIAPGAFEADYFADIEFTAKLVNPNVVTAFNSLPSGEGVSKWELNIPQNVTGKQVPALGLAKGSYFKECDLIFLFDDLYFNGSRHLDGRPFDSPANRPTNLQVPLVRRKM